MSDKFHRERTQESKRKVAMIKKFFFAFIAILRDEFIIPKITIAIRYYR